jgi:hypothetical protein
MDHMIATTAAASPRVIIAADRNFTMRGKSYPSSTDPKRTGNRCAAIRKRSSERKFVWGVECALPIMTVARPEVVLREYRQKTTQIRVGHFKRLRRQVEGAPGGAFALCASARRDRSRRFESCGKIKKSSA